MPANLPLIYGCPSLLDRLMDQAEHHPVPAPHGLSARHFPPLQMFEDDGALYVRAIIPGVPLENITLTLEPGMLVLQGVIPHMPGSHLRRDRPCGPFRREIVLPFPIEAESVSAVVRYGLLTITMPRNPSGKKRTIPVRTVTECAS